ncbi:MAG: ribonuclease HII [Lysobacteraceae bacterium]|jgi:ribonuclease HII
MFDAYQALTPAADIAGVDEAGRGPLAGPVVVAAVILDPAQPIDGIADSKALTPARRAHLYEAIIERAQCWRIECVEADEIDRLNILQATLQGMRRSVQALPMRPTLVLIDGNRLPTALSAPARAIVRGDALEPAIGAASILAKVARDRLMQTLHQQHPQYGFDLHKGYPTPLHLDRLRQHGPCPAHRRSYAPVRACLRD